MSQSDSPIHTETVDDIVKRLNTDLQRGLSSEEVTKRLEQYGSNELVAAESLPRLIAITFIFFAVPTCAMGATLPVLVTELIDLTHNVGSSTGALYFINTLGAAIGALAGGLALLSLYGLGGLVTIAAILNFSIAAVAYMSIQRTP